MSNINHLQIAMDNHDGGAVEDALTQCYKEESAAYIDLLVELLLADWHTRHEDIALEMQRLRSPITIPALKTTSLRKFAYLDYNNSHALARKCVWALADIGTMHAKSELAEIADCEDDVVAEYARKRLDKWELELARKRAE